MTDLSRRHLIQGSLFGAAALASSTAMAAAPKTQH